jgi:nucleoside phosphorylase
MAQPWTEDRLDSCKAIVEFITRHDYGEDSEAVRRALLQDLFFKVSGIQTYEKAAFIAQGAYYSLPKQIRELFNAKYLGVSNLNALSAKQSKDIGIVTVLKVELDAVLATFSGPIQSRVDSDGFKYWFCELERSDGSPTSIVISCVGQAGNVPCAITVEHILSRFSVHLMMLIGIAAGPRGQVGFGDVVIADRVYDYEHVRAEIKDGKKSESPRPLYVEAPREIQEDLDAFDEGEAKARLHSTLQKVDSARLPVEYLAPKFHRGTTAAGERLIADGSLAEMREWVDGRILAGDQEDSGFAQACQFNKTAWCVFRGISDHGDPLKNNDWHFGAALTAATAGYVFIEQTYRPAQSQK